MGDRRDDTSTIHLVIVEAYQGFLEHLSDEEHEIAGASALGLPIAEIASALDCRITLLDWADWQQHERRHDAFQRWMPFPAARPLDARPAAAFPVDFGPRVTRKSVPARDAASRDRASR